MSTVSASTAFADTAASWIPAEWLYDPADPLLVTLRLTPYGAAPTVVTMARSLLAEALGASPADLTGEGEVLLQVTGSDHLVVHLEPGVLVGSADLARLFLDSTYEVCAPCVCELVGPEWCLECAATGRMVEAALAAINREEAA